MLPLFRALVRLFRGSVLFAFTSSADIKMGSFEHDFELWKKKEVAMSTIRRIRKG
jgi:hypothetical protein